MFVSQRVCFTIVWPLEMFYVKTDGKIIGKKEDFEMISVKKLNSV